MVIGIISQLIRPAIRYIGKSIYQTLRAQDRIIDYTYRRTGLYNRGVVRGIKHGLAGGAVVGGILQLGLSAPDTPGNNGQTYSPKPRFTSRKSYQTRNRQTRRPYCRNRNFSSTNRYS